MKIGDRKVRMFAATATRPWCGLFVAAAFVFALSSRARAQLQTHSVALNVGWNPVYLEVEPSDSSTSNLTARFPQIESIWTYDNRFAGEEAFAPEDFGVETPPVRVKRRWHVYVPAVGVLSDLFHLRGGRGYLFKVKDGSAPFTWEFDGTPALTRTAWVPDDYTLAGFSVDPDLSPNDLPTFAAYFRGSSVHLKETSPVYRMAANGALTELDKGTTRIRRGQAYWVFTDGVSDYKGPIEVVGLGLGGLDFGKTLVEDLLELRNTDSVSRTVNLKVKPALADPPAGAPLNAGPVHLQYFDV